MSAIALPIVIEAAKRVGAPLVESVLRKYLGSTAGAVAGTVAGQVIDLVAEKAGVAPGELGTVPPDELNRAVKDAEEVAPELVLAQVESQREANRLMLAELDKGDTWTWAWRPAMMWLIGVFWLWSLVLVPLVNAAAGAAIPIFLAELATLTAVYMGLYLGGHTAKDLAAKWKDARTQR
jgi:hypothetical protein